MGGEQMDRSTLQSGVAMPLSHPRASGKAICVGEGGGVKSRAVSVARLFTSSTNLVLMRV